MIFFSPSQEPIFAALRVISPLLGKLSTSIQTILSNLNTGIERTIQRHLCSRNGKTSDEVSLLWGQPPEAIMERDPL